jgi:hypothetical protein
VIYLSDDLRSSIIVNVPDQQGKTYSPPDNHDHNLVHNQTCQCNTGEIAKALRLVQGIMADPGQVV